MRKWCALSLVPLIIVATYALVAARAKTDTVVLKNGDHLTCEIKNLSRGKLEAQTDAMDKLYIEWADVVALSSAAYFRVAKSDGSLYFGSLEVRESTNELRVVSDTTIAIIPMLSAVSITPIEKTFLSRNKGSAKLGFGYSKSTDLAELYFNVTNRYRSPRTIVDFGANMTVTEQGGEDGTKRRGGVGLAYYYIFARSVTASVGAKVERNDELNVRRRFLGRVAAGYNLLATNESMLVLAAGLAVNSEQSYADEETNSSLEAVLHADYSLFQYNLPETAIDVVLDVYPSLTEQGRYRADLTLDVRREIIDDFFFDLEFYDQYDNKPPSGEQAISDYGIRTSLGYSWN